VPKWRTNISISENLRAEFERARKQEGVIDSLSEFVTLCMVAYSAQARRREKMVFPPEFVSDKSSDKKAE